MSVSGPRQLYALHDVNPDEFGAFPIGEERARELNEMGYAISWAVNDFHGGVRRLSNLKKIRSAFTELDGLDKDTQWSMIQDHIPPSLVIESKNGFHVYWDIYEHIRLDTYKTLQDRICFFFGGDKRARDAARILRAPSYFHMKDPSDPFWVSVKYRSRAKYKSKELMYYFPPIPEDEEKKKGLPKALIQASGDTLSSKLDSLDSEQALVRLSGTAAVNGESYSFRPVSRGRKNIYVDGKSTSNFIDENGRIGSPLGFGPTIWQWLRYFNHSDQKIYAILKEHFGEVF